MRKAFAVAYAEYGPGPHPSEIVGIYDASTVPQMRGRGIGRKMTVVPLLHAKSKGNRIAVLQASGMGKNLYASIGFKEYCKLTNYRLDFSKCSSLGYQFHHKGFVFVYLSHS